MASRLFLHVALSKDHPPHQHIKRSVLSCCPPVSLRHLHRTQEKTTSPAWTRAGTEVTMGGCGGEGQSAALGVSKGPQPLAPAQHPLLCRARPPALPRALHTAKPRGLGHHWPSTRGEAGRVDGAGRGLETGQLCRHPRPSAGQLPWLGGPAVRVCRVSTNTELARTEPLPRGSRGQGPPRLRPRCHQPTDTQPCSLRSSV